MLTTWWDTLYIQIYMLSSSALMIGQDQVGHKPIQSHVFIPIITNTATCHEFRIAENAGNTVERVSSENERWGKASSARNGAVSSGTEGITVGESGRMRRTGGMRERIWWENPVECTWNDNAAPRESATCM
jgi:hypothetical protein